MNEVSEMDKAMSKEDRRADALLEIIESSLDKSDWSRLEDGAWVVTNEFLCGGFAGRAFEGRTKREAAKSLASYFDQHVGHDSIVGSCVTESGWPDFLVFKKTYRAQVHGDGK